MCVLQVRVSVLVVIESHDDRGQTDLGARRWHGVGAWQLEHGR
jgi:hypothetical protein